MVINMLIYFLLAVLICFIIKIWCNTLFLKKRAYIRYLALKENIQKEERKYDVYTEKVLLIDELHNTLFNRLLQITKDFILIQKLIFKN